MPAQRWALWIACLLDLARFVPNNLLELALAHVVGCALCQWCHLNAPKGCPPKKMPTSSRKVELKPALDRVASTCCACLFCLTADRMCRAFQSMGLHAHTPTWQECKRALEQAKAKADPLAFCGRCSVVGWACFFTVGLACLVDLCRGELA